MNGTLMMLGIESWSACMERSPLRIACTACGCLIMTYRIRKFK